MIRKNRISSLGANLRHVRRGTDVVPGLPLDAAIQQRLWGIGFSTELTPGETVLPLAVGPVSTYNAEGKYIIHRDRPMETAYTQVEWTWEEWHGRSTETQSKIVDRPYKRYPRSFLVPPSIELSIEVNAHGEKFVAAPPIQYVPENDELLLHVINLFLEIFRECEVFTEDLSRFIAAPVRKLNWKLLPPGKRPWPALRPNLEPIFRNQPAGNQVVIASRLEHIHSFGPEFVAVGTAGFQGYVVFAFPAKNLYVLESVHPDNATYVFREAWATLSQRTKAEILSANLQFARIIHREGWTLAIDDLLG